MSEALAVKLDALSRSVGSLVTVAEAMETDIPLYCVGGLALAVASLGEQVTNRGLEVHALATGLRPDAHAAAGLIPPDLVAYVRTLLVTGTSPGPEVGRWA